MIFKFKDKKNNLKTLLLDESDVKKAIKVALKEGKILYGPQYEEELKKYSDTVPEMQINKYCPEFKTNKLSKTDAILLSPYLLDKSDNYMEQVVPEEERLYTFDFVWDNKSIYEFSNVSNNPEAESSQEKYVSSSVIDTYARKNHLIILYEKEEVDQDVILTTYAGRKKNFASFFEMVAELLTTAEQAFDGKKYTNYQEKEIKELEALQFNPELKPLKEYIEEIKGYIETDKEIINNPNSSAEDIEDAKGDLEDDQKELKYNQNKYSKMLNKTIENIQNGKYDPDLVEEVKNKYKGHVYTSQEAMEYCDYNKMGLERATREDAEFFTSSQITNIGDANSTWFGLTDTYLTSSKSDYKIIHNNTVYDAYEVCERLIKAHKDSKTTTVIEQWIKDNPELVSNIIKNKKGENKMKDSLKNLKFRFSDGTIIEVEDSEGKDFQTVKDEAIKVYKQFKSAKDKDLVKEAEKETEEVLEEYDAKATNDSVEEEAVAEAVEEATEKAVEEAVTEATEEATEKAVEEAVENEKEETAAVDAFASAKEAFEAGQTLKEWFAQTGKDLVEGATSLAKKENAITIWRSIKENANMSEDEEWDLAYQNTNYQDSCEDCGDVKIQDEVEENEEDGYEVIVGGKQIGVYKTLEEAEEAEKKALEAVEKGIPKPTENE